MLSITVCILALQQIAAPVLHHRGDPSLEDASAIVVREHARRLLPENASGEYKLGESGEVIQVTEQFGEISGYITRLGQSDSDNGATLTYFFTQATGNGQHFSFRTAQVHGIWYSFDGEVVRGPGANRAVDGMYLLEGALTSRNEANRTTQRQTISLKLAAQR